MESMPSDFGFFEGAGVQIGWLATSSLEMKNLSMQSTRVSPNQ